VGKKYRWIALLLAGVLLLAGCGKKEPEPSASASAGASTEPAPSAVVFPPFKVETMQGDTLTEKMFEDHDVTVVYIWATWCGVCVSDMENMNALSERLPEGAAFVSICSDAEEEPDKAQQIVDEQKIIFPVLVPNIDMILSFVSAVQYFPTTVFVNREGEIVGALTGKQSISAVVGVAEDIIEEQGM
jgi:thiol-disulfide isomerase/thioredoxin